MPKTEPKPRQIDALSNYDDDFALDRASWENVDSLEENMHQILTMLKSVTGESSWKDSPLASLRDLAGGSTVSSDAFFKYEVETSTATTSISLPSGYWYRYTSEQSKTQVFFDGILQDNDSYSEEELGTSGHGVVFNFSETIPSGITISILYFGGTT